MKLCLILKKTILLWYEPRFLDIETRFLYVKINSKLTYEDKINLYNDRKKGLTIPTLVSKYNIRHEGVEYLIRLIDKHGLDILKTTKYKYYSPHEKERIINRVLINNESRNSVAIDEGLLSSGMLANWIKKYQDMGYNIVERKRGRSPTIMPKNKKSNVKETMEEELERLKKENLYLKAELEYSKKLRAIVQARKNQQQKKK